MREFRLAPILVVGVAVFALSAGGVLAKSPRLPRTAPLPELVERAAPVPPATEPQAQTPPQSAPVPDERPDDAPGSSERPDTPDTAPKPPEKPADVTEKPEPEEKPADKPAEEPKKPPLDPRASVVPAAEMPAEEKACRERLKALGAEFEEHKAEQDTEIGCAIPYPIVLKKLTGKIDIAPAPEMNCQMAEAAARFMADVASPAAKTELGSEIKSISQASAYVCRPRHGTQKISEHAFGNALDIARFTLTDGTDVDVKAGPPEKQGKFLDAVRKAACGPFKTVLGPGSDPDHALHFHLDLEPRRHGGTFCQ